MKIRNGFVSNSSTSSFLIYGVCFDDKYEIASKKDLEEYDGYILDYLSDKTTLDVYSPWDSVYIGESWSNIGDDETGAQFKERVKAELRKLLPDLEDEDFGTYEEAWHD